MKFDLEDWREEVRARMEEEHQTMTACGEMTAFGGMGGMNRCRRMLKSLEQFGLEEVEGRDLENE